MKSAIISSKRAFTFVELLIVVAIIGVLAGVSFPALKKAFDNFESESFVKDIYYFGRYLQGRAIAEGKIYYLKTDPDQRSFAAKIREEGELREITGRYGKVYQAPQGISVTLEPQELEGIYFYPDGSIDQAEITFENRQKTTLRLIFKGVSGGIQIQ